MLTPLARLIFKLTGWRTLGEKPALKRYILIGAPHTSNWDLFYGFCAWRIYGVRPRYLIKREVDRFPLNIFLRATGALPIDRSQQNSLTDSLAETLKASDNLIVVIAPEGTRKTVERWKTGFYFAALKSGVPIIFGAMDYSTKTTHLSAPFHPTGDINADFEKIREFYRSVTARYPEKFSLESIRSG